MFKTACLLLILAACWYGNSHADRMYKTGKGVYKTGKALTLTAAAGDQTPIAPHHVDKHQAGDASCGHPTKFEEKAIKTILHAHNHFRSLQGASNMKVMRWNDELAARAQELADTCVFEHAMTTDCSGGGTGQNLYSYSSTKSYPFTHVKPEWAVGAWYKEVKDFNYNTSNTRSLGSTGGVVGHYTQVVWANSDEVGCGAAVCPQAPGSKWWPYIYACNYKPAGNWIGQYPFLRDGAPCSGCPNRTGYGCTDGLCDFLECASNPCLHGGECIEQWNGYRCNCTRGKAGRICEYNTPKVKGNIRFPRMVWRPSLSNTSSEAFINESTSFCKKIEAGLSGVDGVEGCVVDAFRQGSVIVDFTVSARTSSASSSVLSKLNSTLTNNASSIFPNQNVGVFGVQASDNCNPSPCWNSSCSLDSDSNAICNCLDPWTGANCTEVLPICKRKANPCHHNGTCTDGKNVTAFTCECKFGYTGDTCKTDEWWNPIVLIVRILQWLKWINLHDGREWAKIIDENTALTLISDYSLGGEQKLYESFNKKIREKEEMKKDADSKRERTRLKGKEQQQRALEEKERAEREQAEKERAEKARTARIGKKSQQRERNQAQRGRRQVQQEHAQGSQSSVGQSQRSSAEQTQRKSLQIQDEGNGGGVQMPAVSAEDIANARKELERYKKNFPLPQNSVGQSQRSSAEQAKRKSLQVQDKGNGGGVQMPAVSEEDIANARKELERYKKNFPLPQSSAGQSQRSSTAQAQRKSLQVQDEGNGGGVQMPAVSEEDIANARKELERYKKNFPLPQSSARQSQRSSAEQAKRKSLQVQDEGNGGGVQMPAVSEEDIANARKELERYKKNFPHA